MKKCLRIPKRAHSENNKKEQNEVTNKRALGMIRKCKSLFYL